MLYTFELTESQLDWVTDYLDRQWQGPGPYDRYIWAVQRSLIDDRCIVTVECDEQSRLMILLALG
jgi:hypothetical protein